MEPSPWEHGYCDNCVWLSINAFDARVHVNTALCSFNYDFPSGNLIMKQDPIIENFFLNQKKIKGGGCNIPFGCAFDAEKK